MGDAVETRSCHARWQGFTAFDMIMPMFLFIVGVSMPLAISRRVEVGEMVGRFTAEIVRRVAVLWMLGMLVQMAKQYVNEEDVFPELFSNTLQAIAVGYLVTSLALIHFT